MVDSVVHDPDAGAPVANVPDPDPPGRAAGFRGRLRRASLPAAFVALAALQVVAILYYEPPSLLLSDAPRTGLDNNTHVEQTWRFIEALDGWGHTWGYDPHLLAGMPSGTIFDADNKGWELWTWALTKLGVPRGLAFNLFALLAHVLLPWVVFLSARLFGLARGPALLAGALALAVWYADSCLHWVWWEGMIAWIMSSYLCLLPLALLYRFCADRRTRHALGLVVTLPLLHLIHPYSFLTLALPMTALYVRAFRSLRLRDHALLGTAVVATVAANAWWLVVALRFWHYILDSGVAGAAVPRYLLTDWLGLNSNTSVVGDCAMRTGLRFLILGAAALGVLLWRRRRDDRLLPLGGALVLFVGVAYLGGISHVLRQVQPYRFIMPAIFFATIPAAALATAAWRRGASAFPRGILPAVALLGVVALPRLARDVLFVTPALVPQPAWPAQPMPAITDTTAFGALAYPPPHIYRTQPANSGFQMIAALIERSDDGQSRVLVEDWNLGEYLAWRTNAQVLGGFLWINLQHAAANMMRRHPLDLPTEAELRRYLEDYAVRWVILNDKQAEYSVFGDLLVPVGDLWPYRAYRTTVPISLIAGNTGTVHAELNRIEVRGTDPDRDAVLRYHWMETLVCRPSCTVVREPLADDPIGFMRIRAPHPPDFVVENGY